MRLRAQISSLDVLLAVLVFALVMGLFYSAYSALATVSEPQVLRVRVALSNALERSGSPAGWNASSVRAIGFASSWRVLDGAKLAEFMNLTLADPLKARELLAGAAEAVSFNLSYANGSQVQVSTPSFAGSVSWQSGSFGQSVFVARSWALLGGEKVKAELMVS